MQLTLTTDYAIRTLLYLAIKGVTTNSAEISRQMGIQSSYILTVTRRLRDAGMIKSSLGSSGGHRLARLPKDISLLEVVELMEGTTKINRCLEKDHYCSRFATDTCPVRRVYQKLQSDFETTLKNTTIQTLMRNND